MLTDSHCHLNSKDFDADREEVIARALDSGVSHMVAIDDVELADRHDAFFATVGVHPHEASKADHASLARVRDLAHNHAKVIAVGEIGLDYHYDFSPRERQREVFTEQIKIAGEAGLPIVIHTREAWDDTFELIERHWSPFGIPGVMHCFTGGPTEARRCLQLGFFLSFAGIVTFPKSLDIQQAAREAPDDRILIETDAPYLAPAPKRGKRNEPAFVVHTAAKLAALRESSAEKVAELTTKNFERVFGRARVRS